MRNKLGYHFDTLTGPARESVFAMKGVETSKWLTSAIDMGVMQQMRVNNPNMYVIGRHVLGDNPPIDGIQRVHMMQQALMEKGAMNAFNALETPWNEEAQTGQALKARVHEELKAITAMRKIWPSVDVIAGGMSVGNPPDIKADWTIYLPVVNIADGIGLHEYGSPFMHSEPDDVTGNSRPVIAPGYNAGWWCLRYRMVRQLLEENMEFDQIPPFYITETGRDHGLTLNGENHGWRHNAGYGGGDLQNYINEIDWYARELQRDPYVKGAYIFACGTYGPGNFGDFDVAGEKAIQDLLQRDYSGVEIFNAHKFPGPDQVAKAKETQASSQPTPPAPSQKPSKIMIRAYYRELPGGQRNVWWDWANTDGNINPLIGEAGLKAFSEHLKTLGADNRRPVLWGFPIETLPKALNKIIRPPKSMDGPPIIRASDLVSQSTINMASLLHLQPIDMQAIANVESGSEAFNAEETRPLVRFEAHEFARMVTAKEPTGGNMTANTMIAFRGTDSWKARQQVKQEDGQWIDIHASQDNEWHAIQTAIKFNQSLALQATSMGKWQILGEHYEQLGFTHPVDMWNAMRSSETVQDLLFVQFMIANPEMRMALADGRLEKFVELWNGPGNVPEYMKRIDVEIDKIQEFYGIAVPDPVKELDKTAGYLTRED